MREIGTVVPFTELAVSVYDIHAYTEGLRVRFHKIYMHGEITGITPEGEYELSIRGEYRCTRKEEDLRHV